MIALLLHALRGRVDLKEWLASAVDLDMASVEWNKEVIAFVREEAARGREIMLATAAAEMLAQKAASHLEEKFGLGFGKVLSSSGTTNLLGAVKASALKKEVGEKGVFDYIGDSPSQDPPVFAAARLGHFVNPTKKLLEDCAKKDSRVFYTQGGKRRGLGRRILDVIQAKK